MVSNRSNGIYRSVIAAIVGLILIGAAPNKKGINQPNQSPSQKAETDQLKAIVAAIKESNKPPKPDNGCKAGKDDRSSDLCAQWKAADAAKDAAWWTFFAAITTVIGVIVGGFTLVAAGFAAWYAKKAAIETGKNASAAIDAVLATSKANEIAQTNLELYKTSEAGSLTPSLGWLKDGRFHVTAAFRGSGICQIIMADLTFFRYEKNKITKVATKLSANIMSRHKSIDQNIPYAFPPINFPDDGIWTVAGGAIWKDKFGKIHMCYIGFDILVGIREINSGDFHLDFSMWDNAIDKLEKGEAVIQRR